MNSIFRIKKQLTIQVRLNLLKNIAAKQSPTDKVNYCKSKTARK